MEFFNLGLPPCFQNPTKTTLRSVNKHIRYNSVDKILTGIFVKTNPNKKTFKYLLVNLFEHSICPFP